MRPPPPCASNTRSESVKGIGQFKCISISFYLFISIVSGTNPFRGDHRGSQRMGGMAGLPEMGTVRGLSQASHNQTGDAFGCDLVFFRTQLKSHSGGISFIFGSKLKPAGGDDSDAPPVLVARFQHLVYKLAGGGIPLLGNGPFVSVLYLITSGFQLGDTAINAI